MQNLLAAALAVDFHIRAVDPSVMKTAQSELTIDSPFCNSQSSSHSSTLESCYQLILGKYSKLGREAQAFHAFQSSDRSPTQRGAKCLPVVASELLAQAAIRSELWEKGQVWIEMDPRIQRLRVVVQA
ncbi:hypothetical protein ACQKWADRAFT_305568 [Trichoderma austrokoningii]